MNLLKFHLISTLRYIRYFNFGIILTLFRLIFDSTDGTAIENEKKLFEVFKNLMRGFIE